MLKHLIPIYDPKYDKKDSIINEEYAPGDTGEELNIIDKELSLKYSNGDSIYVIITIEEIFFSGVFTFELKEEGMYVILMWLILYQTLESWCVSFYTFYVV